MKSLSIVVPTYNGARYLRATLDSLALNAKSGSLEVIVVDDGSADESVEIARRHGVVTEVVRQENMGVAIARNRGLARAAGEWVAFLDQDDLWHPYRYRQLLGFVRSEPADLVLTREVKFASRAERDALSQQYPDVGDWADDYVDAGDEIRELASGYRLSARPAFTVLTLRDLLGGPVSTTTSFVAKRDLLQSVGGFAPHARAMDDYITLVNASRLTPVYRLEEPSVFYRVHLQATSRATELGLPFLSNSLALQLGGMFEGDESGPQVGPLHEHLFRQVVDSDQFWRDPRFRRVVLGLGTALFDDIARQVSRAAARRVRTRLGKTGRRA